MTRKELLVARTRDAPRVALRRLDRTGAMGRSSSGVHDAARRERNSGGERDGRPARRMRPHSRSDTRGTAGNCDGTMRRSRSIGTRTDRWDRGVAPRRASRPASHGDPARVRGSRPRQLDGFDDRSQEMDLPRRLDGPLASAQRPSVRSHDLHSIATMRTTEVEFVASPVRRYSIGDTVVRLASFVSRTDPVRGRPFAPTVHTRLARERSLPSLLRLPSRGGLLRVGRITGRVARAGSSERSLGVSGFADRAGEWVSPGEGIHEYQHGLEPRRR